MYRERLPELGPPKDVGDYYRIEGIRSKVAGGVRMELIREAIAIGARDALDEWAHWKGNTGD